MIDNDYEIRKQSQIEAADKKALARLEEIDTLMTRVANKSFSYDQLKAFREIKYYELDAYQTWCENKLAMLQEKKTTMKDQYGDELAALAKMEREHKQQANEAALTAAVEKAYSRLTTGMFDANNQEDYEQPIPMEETWMGAVALEGRAAFRLLLTRHQEREKRLREFVTWVAWWKERDAYFIDEYKDGLIKLGEEARNLLTELGGESEVSE